MTRFLAVTFVLLSATSISHAAIYNVSDEVTCLALPVAVTWIPPSETPGSVCQLDADLTLIPGDSLTLLSNISFSVPSGRTLNNFGGMITIKSGARLFQRGTISNQVGGVIVDRGFWDARDNATIVNFASTIEVTNQLTMPFATLSNSGVFRVDGVFAVVTIDNLSTFTNSSSVNNTGRIRVNGTLRNNAIINNNGQINLSCDGRYEENGSLMGNSVDVPYCINGGDWSDASAWDQNQLPPTDARIFISSGINYLDIPFSLTGRIEITAVLEIKSGAQLEILAGGSVINNNGFTTNALIINNHSLINRGELVNEGLIINNADFGNEGLISSNGLIENHGLFQNTSTFIQTGIDNRSDGLIENAGFWKINRSLNHNSGALRISSGGELELNNTLVNESGGLIENFGLLTVNDSLSNPGSLENVSDGLIVNKPGANLNVTSADASLENAGETRNEGTIGNDGMVNNPGRICGPGDINGNAVSGNAPELSCNRAPTAVAKPDAGIFECTGLTTNVALDGRFSSDPDLRDELMYNWSPATGLIDPTAALTSGNFGLGSENYTLTVMDLLGESDSDGASFTVRDTTAPALTCPADITLVADDICIGTGDSTLAEAVDGCDTNPSVTRTPAGNNWSLGETEVTHIGGDGSGNIAVCASTVEVIDQTIPAIQCNTDSVVVRPGMPVSFQATATDNCSVASVSVSAFDCWKINNAGKRVDKTDQCVVSLSGDTINILESSGVGTIIGWTVEAVDGSGNAETASCEVVSIRPNRN